MPIAIHWFRRDLRLDDNTALWHALAGDVPVLCLFIFDTNILDQLADKYDRRVDFIYRQIQDIAAKLAQKNSTLLVRYGNPLTIWSEISQQYDIETVHTNRDYEPYAQQRDREIYDLLQKKGIAFKGYKDHVVFEKNEVIKPDGKPYTVFTPYSKRWLLRYELDAPPISGDALSSNNFYTCPPLPTIALETMGFIPTDSVFPSAETNPLLLQNYQQQRDLPAANGTSNLSVHFRFGTISIRKMAALGKKNSATWLNELIWRDFYQAILYHFPHSASAAFKPDYDRIEWLNNPQQFEAWCAGKTGYPIVDAGMRQLNATGFMHNRVRMIVASFLTKHLLIDWRWGEGYFAAKLLDYDMASNVGGWQWAASSGCDAAPYFRVFSPDAQTQKFDPKHAYIRQWVPEYGTINYPKPIVEHKMARERVLAVYKKAVGKSETAD